MAKVEVNAEIPMPRHGKGMAHGAPDGSPLVASAFSDFWPSQDIDLQAPADTPAEDVASLDE